MTIVIVSYRTPGPLRRCLAALGTDHRVIVVDNASGDETVEMIRNEFPHVEVIANSKNRGFGGANNQGAALADSDWILYLNSDCYASPGAVKRLAEALNAAGAVGGGGKLLNMDGSLQQSVAGELTLGAVAREQFLIEKLTTPYWQTPTVAQAVTQVMGACLMVRRDLNLQFDESFFLYCEDTDLCQRIRQHGEIWYIPEAEFTHELGTSSKRNPWLGIARYNAGKEHYFRKHDGFLAMVACLMLDRLGALIRLILKPRQFSVWWRVLTARTAKVWPKVS